MAERAFAPAYLALHRRGELGRRAETAVAALASCRVCPRLCGVDRLAGETAVCRTGRLARVSSYFPHFGEEDCLRGWGGSGTIFFAQCNLRCVFCQNADISQNPKAGTEVSPKRLAAMMLELQGLGCHNINFVTPEHVVPQILEALPLAVEAGLRLPITDNRTGRTYEVPIQHDTIDAMHLRQIKVNPDDFGMMSYDPAFKNTASTKSTITYIDGDKGILRISRLPH
jgi:uncharacterized Fe-S radical SAM superfamily protein PflX